MLGIKLNSIGYFIPNAKTIDGRVYDKDGNLTITGTGHSLIMELYPITVDCPIDSNGRILFDSDYDSTRKIGRFEGYIGMEGNILAKKLGRATGCIKFTNSKLIYEIQDGSFQYTVK